MKHIILLLTAFILVACGDSKTYTTQNYSQDFSTGLVHNKESADFTSTASKHHTSNEVVPGSYSLRGNAGPVENQGKCGSCWDFSLTTVLRGTLIVGGKDPGRLSFNYLLNCDTDEYGCNGGTMAAAAYLVTPKGAPAYGSDGAYTAHGGSCLRKPVVGSAVNYHMLGSNNGPSFRDVAYVVGVLHRPVSVTVTADSNWKSYKGGVYNGCTNNNSMTNHMVSIEGYSCGSSTDKSGNCVFDSSGNLPGGVGTWIIRNSWGTSWGDSGYITTKATDSKGEKCNAVASEALYFDPK